MAPHISNKIRIVSAKLRNSEKLPPQSKIPIDFLDSEEEPTRVEQRHSLPVRAVINAADSFKHSSLPVQILIALATLIATATGLAQALAPLLQK